jgi:hypothetical protein
MRGRIPSNARIPFRRITKVLNRSMSGESPKGGARSSVSAVSPTLFDFGAG